MARAYDWPNGRPRLRDYAQPERSEEWGIHTRQVEGVPGHHFNTGAVCPVARCGHYHYSCFDCRVDCTAGTPDGPAHSSNLEEDKAIHGLHFCRKCWSKREEKKPFQDDDEIIAEAAKFLADECGFTPEQVKAFKKPDVIDSVNEFFLTTAAYVRLGNSFAYMVSQAMEKVLDGPPPTKRKRAKAKKGKKK